MANGSDDALAAHELDLVTRAASGDAAAFERFFQRHGAHAQLLVERLVGPGETADRVVVEAFEKTVRRLPLLGARNSTPGVYLLTTARNGAYAELGRARPEAGDEALAALFTLPSRQRELLALREIGLDPEQAAAVAGVAPEDVGPQVARARLRLVDALEGTSLSVAVNDPADEALLGAVALRAPGVEDPELEARVQSRSGQDETFAQAVAVARSSARSTGRLPGIGDATRLAAAATEGALKASTPTTAAPSAPAPAPAPAPSRAEPAGAANEGDEAAAADPFDDMIGDEAAWGIVDGDTEAEDVGKAPTAPNDAEPTAAAAPTAEAEAGDTEAATHVAESSDPDAPHSGSWDALDWPDDADAAALAGDDAPAGDTPSAPADATRAFDLVDAGLADADDEHDDDLDDAPRSKWRFLIWVIALLLVFVGVAFAAYTIANAARDSEPVPQTLNGDKNTEASDVRGPETEESSDAANDGDRSESRSSNRDREGSSGSGSSSSSRSRSSGGNSSSSNSGSGTSGSGGGSGGSTSNSSSGGSSSTSSSSSGGSSGGNSSSSNNTSSSDDRTVSGGPTESGGAIRGDGTTP